MTDRLESPIWIRLKRTEDLCRLAASIMSLGQPIYLVRMRKEEEAVLGVLAVYRDYFRYYGIPIFYYTQCSGPCLDKRYVSFKLDEIGERIEFTDKSVPGTVMIPIVEFESMPEMLAERREEKGK